MKVAATRMWRTHVNLSPMYFNKTERCYKHNDAVHFCVVCLCIYIHSMCVCARALWGERNWRF